MKSALIFSGGLDSTVLLWELLHQGNDVLAISFNYGQRHRKELAAAREICALANVERLEVDLTSLGRMLGASALLGGAEVPHGHYEAESMKATVVPNRNMILLSAAAGIAMARGCEELLYGAHGGDHAIYLDCREEFIEASAAAISEASGGSLSLKAPFLWFDKSDIVDLGRQVGAPMGMTWSCYEGGELHCGKCGTCTERIEAFAKAEVLDPTKYRG